MYIVISAKIIRRALLDLGSSVNLLPCTTYKRLGLGELRPTKIVLQFANRSTRLPRCIVEHELIKVREFIFRIDFMVCNAERVPNVEPRIPAVLRRFFFVHLMF